jgi:hypothetical protein
MRVITQNLMPGMKLQTIYHRAGIQSSHKIEEIEPRLTAAA